MRYQEWWYEEIGGMLSPFFESVEVINGMRLDEKTSASQFSPLRASCAWEAGQIRQLATFDVRRDDVFFFLDISYPGLLPYVAFHYKNPCFAFCHASSRNTLDYFVEQLYKQDAELAFMQRCNKVFFGTRYSASKWPELDNAEVVGLPAPDYFPRQEPVEKKYDVGIISRRTPQKVDGALLKMLEAEGWNIGWHDHTTSDTWQDYLSWIESCGCIVSLAREETYGYQAWDADRCMVPFICPNKYGYVEVVRGDMRYTHPEHMLKLIREWKGKKASRVMSQWAIKTAEDWNLAVAEIILEEIKI